MENTEEKVEETVEETVEEVKEEAVEEITEEAKDEKIEADKEKAMEIIENFKSDFKKNIFKPFKSIGSLITNLGLVGLLAYLKMSGIKNYTWLGVLAPMWLWVVYTILSLIIVGAVFGTVAIAAKADDKSKFKPKHMFLVLMVSMLLFIVTYNKVLLKISYADTKAIEFTIVVSIIINIVVSVIKKWLKVTKETKEDKEN